MKENVGRIRRFVINGFSKKPEYLNIYNDKWIQIPSSHKKGGKYGRKSKDGYNGCDIALSWQSPPSLQCSEKVEDAITYNNTESLPIPPFQTA